MRLTLRVAAAFLVGLIVVLGIYAAQVYAWDAEQFERDLGRNAQVAGTVLTAAMQALSNTGDSDAAMALIKAANVSEDTLRIRWRAATDPLVSNKNEDRAGLRQALQTGKPFSTYRPESDGESRFTTYYPVGLSGDRLGFIELGESVERHQRHIHRVLGSIAIATVTVALVSGMLAYGVGLRFVAQPMNELIAGFRAVAQGNLAPQLHVRQRDEFGVLAAEFGRMCAQLADAREQLSSETAGRIRALEQLRHADRLSIMGSLSAGIAHELGTPLNVVWERASMIVRGDVVGEQIGACAQIIVDQAARMTNSIKLLLNFARPRSPQRVSIDLRQLVLQTIELVAPVARANRVAVECSTSSAMAQVDPDQIQQVLTNLLMNATQAMPSGGRIRVDISRDVEARRDQASAGDVRRCATIAVRDEGQGIQPSDLPRIFEPFFSTKPTGKGTGLGLSISQGIILEHGGWITVASRLGQGAEFTVFLPQEG